VNESMDVLLYGQWPGDRKRSQEEELEQQVNCSSVGCDSHTCLYKYILYIYTLLGSLGNTEPCGEKRVTGTFV